MKLFVNVGFSVDHPLEYDESFEINTYGIAVMSELDDDIDAEVLAAMVKEALCPAEINFSGEVRHYQILTDEEFSVLEHLLPVFKIDVSK